MRRVCAKCKNEFICGDFVCHSCTVASMEQVQTTIEDALRVEVQRLREALKELRDWFEGWQDFHMSSRWVARIDAALSPGKEG